MNATRLLTVVLVLLPYAFTMEPNGSLRMAIARWAEGKGRDLRREVKRLDNSKTKLEPNEPYVVHERTNPLSRSESSQLLWKKKFEEPGTHSFDMVTKKLSTTWAWSRPHNMDYVLNISQPVYIDVPVDSLIHVKTGVKPMGKDFWEFKTPMPWVEAEETCRAAGLKLAQPKTKQEVEELQKALHKRIHNRESGCQDETWNKINGYCFLFVDDFYSRNNAAEHCKHINSILPVPALGNDTAWQEAVAEALTGKGNTYAKAFRGPDSQWLWEDDHKVKDDEWTPGNPEDRGDCSVIYSKTGKLIDKDCSVSWQTLCQGHSSSHWLGALGSDDKKCVQWVDGKCIEEEDHDPNSNIEDLWQAGQPGDLVSSNYALQLQIENEKPFVLREATDRRPFLCESACPLGFMNLGPQCLLIQKMWVTWQDAHANCVKMGLQLYETEEESKLNTFLQSQKITGTYWIGGHEKKIAGHEVNFSIVKKLPYICELAHGTRKMNVTNELSYSDQEKVKLPKIVTPSNNCTVTVNERTITETYPFSVQMDITGWIWVEYSTPTDEHGSNNCDNNNDWVSGEWCWAHSKWGYSTSYLHDGDQIMTQGDSARMTLDGKVTYTFKEHEVSITQCGSDRASYSGRGKKLRRGKRSITSPEKSLKNYNSKDSSKNNDDNTKPMMSQLGKRAGDWVRALAQEKNAHLVAYTINQLSPTVTDMKLEREVSGLSIPGSIFEEEFENTGSEHVVTTFSKTKNIANSYRWSVSKGLSVEDSHIVSFSNTRSQSASNTFSLSNNIAQTDGTSRSISQGTTDTINTSEGGSVNVGIGSSQTDSRSDSQSSSRGGSQSAGTSQTDSSSNTDGSSASRSVGSTTGGSQSASESDSSSSSTSDSSSISAGSSASESQNRQTSVTDTASASSSRGSSSSESHSRTDSTSQTSSKTDSSSFSIGVGVTASVEATAGFNVGFASASVTASLSTSVNTNSESTQTSERSSTSSSDNTRSSEKSVTSENTQTNEKSTASESGSTSERGTTSDRTKAKEKTISNDQTRSTEEQRHHELSQTDDNTSTQERTDSSEKVQTLDNTQNFDDTLTIDRDTSIVNSIDKDTSTTYDNSRGRENSYSLDNNINQETSKSSEISRGGDLSRDSQHSQENQKTKSQHVSLDKNEDIETSEAETLDTANEVNIPPNTRVKIEWRIERSSVRLPWKANIHMTGWINVRLRNHDQVCDKYLQGHRWTYNYTSSCDKDNRLYGYPLSYLKDKNFIQQGDGLRFVAHGSFEAVTVTSHFLRVTETALEPDDLEEDHEKDYYDYYSDDEPRPQSRRKRALRRLPRKVTDYHLEFDEHGTGRANLGNNNRYFKRFHAKKKFIGKY